MATLQAENQKIIKAYQEQYGWMFLAKEVSDYTRCTFFEILDRSAMEVLSLVMVIRAKSEVVKLSGNHG